MQDVKATGYDLLCETGDKEDNRAFDHSFRIVLSLKTSPFLSPGQTRNCRLAVSKWFADLSQDLSQTPTRSQAAGFGGMTVKIDEPTGFNWNDTTVNERERVGVVKIRATYVHDNLDSTHGTLHHGCYLCAWERVTAHSSRHMTDIRHAVTDSQETSPSARTMAAWRTRNARRPRWRRSTSPYAWKSRRGTTRRNSSRSSA